MSSQLATAPMMGTQDTDSSEPYRTSPYTPDLPPNIHTADSRDVHSLLKGLLAQLNPTQDGPPPLQSNTLAQTQTTGHQTPELPSDAVSPIDADLPPPEPASKRRSNTLHLDMSDMAMQPRITAAAFTDFETSIAASRPEDHGLEPLYEDMNTTALQLATMSQAALVPPAMEADTEPPNSSMAFLEATEGQIDGKSLDHAGNLHKRGQVSAYAKFEFPDGDLYMNTKSIEFGRDQRAFAAAQARQAEAARTRAEEAELKAREAEVRPKSRSSQIPDRVRRTTGSQVQGSVVSDRGGFCAVDRPDEDEAAEKKKERSQNRSHSSQHSVSSVVRMADIELNRPPPFDYLKNAEEQALFDNEVPRPVEPENLLPDPDLTPLIPIHPLTNDVDTEVLTHKSISRRHVRVAWNDRKDCFVLQVLGRNGCHLDGEFQKAQSVACLKHGSVIGVSGIEFTFKLPITHEHTSDESDGDDNGDSPPPAKLSSTPTSNDAGRSASPARKQKKTKILLKVPKKPEPVVVPRPLGPDGQPLPPKKRGPGRPPKDGVMSTRERRLIEKAQKAAAARAANGGVTPPPTGRNAMYKSSAQPSSSDPTKTEKRKYTKRKRVDGDGDGDVLPSIEGGDADVVSEDNEQTVKKSRASRSPSPEYPAKETLTEEQMAKPPDNYARLIYDVLDEIYPRELGLRQIYRALKVKFPYFVHKVQTDGWQSSVRHNLNAEHLRYYNKGRKDGKGWAWRSIPGQFLETKEDAVKKRKAQEAAQAEARAKANNANRNHHAGPPASRPPPQWYGNPLPSGTVPNPNGPTYFVSGPNGPMGNTPMPQWQPQAGLPRSGPPHNGTNPPFPSYPPSQMPPGHHWTGAAPAAPPGYTGPLLQPPSRPSSTNPHHSTSNPNPNPNPNPALTPTNLPSNMPCTLRGIDAIETFKSALLAGDDPVERARSLAMFTAARQQVLHNTSDVLLPDSDKEHVQVLVGHIREIVAKFPNPAFRGFTEQPAVSLVKGEGEK